MLDAIERLELVEQVAPIQLAIRLLIPEGSRLLELAEIQRLVEPYDQVSLAFPWRHPDPAMDVLQRDVFRLIADAARPGEPAGGSLSRRGTFDAVRDLAGGTGRSHPRAVPPRRARAAVPYLEEPWYC
jgi:hypothetical protein